MDPRTGRITKECLYMAAAVAGIVSAVVGLWVAVIGTV